MTVHIDLSTDKKFNDFVEEFSETLNQKEPDETFNLTEFLKGFEETDEE